MIHVKNLTQYQVHSKSSIDISFETSKLELMRLCFPWYAVFSFKNSAFHSTQGCVAAWMRQGFSEFRWFREECESHSVMSDSLQPMDYTVHGILRPEYWSWQPFPSLGDLPNSGIESRSPTLWATREVQGRMDTGIYMTMSLHCSPETITTLLISYLFFSR